MAKLSKNEQHKLIAKEWSYVKSKKEVIAKHGEKGKQRVNKALKAIIEAKKDDPFILYDLGFEKLNDQIKKSIDIVNSNKKKFSKEVVIRAGEIENIIKQSSPASQDSVQTVTISDNALLNTYIKYVYPLGSQKFLARNRKEAGNILALTGFFVSNRYLERVLRVRPKESEKILEILIKLKVVGKGAPNEIQEKPFTKVAIHSITSALKPYVSNENSIKAMIADFDRFKRIKTLFYRINRIISILKTRKTKRPKCIFFLKLRKWKALKRDKYNSSIKFVEFLNIYKDVFNNSSMLKGIDLSLAKPFIDNVALESVDLSGANLSGINFENCRFSKSFFIGTNFENALIERVEILRCNLTGSNWAGTSFTKCNFTNSRFDKSNMTDCQFFMKNRLNHATFREANLQSLNFVANTNFDRLDLTGADLSGATVKKCSFRNCNFSKVKANQIYASGANFQGCNFREAEILEADMDLTTLAGSDFRYANLSKGNFKNANFSQSDLSYSIVDNAELNRADFLACNLYLARMRNSSFEKAINLVGTEYPHIVIGDVLDTKTIHRATVTKRLRDIESSKDEVHFGTVSVKEFRSVVGDDNVFNKLLFLIKNDSGKISETEIRYNFLKTRNFTKIKETLELNKASNKDKILAFLGDQDFLDKNGIKLKIWDLPEKEKTENN